MMIMIDTECETATYLKTKTASLRLNIETALEPEH